MLTMAKKLSPSLDAKIETTEPLGGLLRSKGLAA